MMRRTPKYSASGLARFTAFDEANEDETITVSLPEDLSALSVDDINALRATAIEAADELISGGDDSNATIEALEGLNDIRVTLDAELAARATTAANRAAQIAALAAQFHPVAEVEPTEDADEDEAEEESDEDAEEVEDTTEAEAEVVAEAEEILAEAVETPELIAASGEPATEPVTTFQRGPISVPRLTSRQTPQEETPVTTPVRSAYRAAVNVPGLVPNADMDLGEVSMAFAEMVERAGRTAVKPGGGRFSNRHQIAHIVKEFDSRAVVDGDNADDALRFVTSQDKVNAMVAAGGWCAPSETAYDLCELESREGIISIPEIALNRGGLRFTQGPDWADIFSSTGFSFTEANDIAGNYDDASSGTSDKPCDLIPCPIFTDVRLDAAGVCITAGNLMNRAYPELVKRYVSGAVTAHFHRVATDVISRMVAQSTAVTPTVVAANSSAAINLLGAIELQMEDIKYKRRMARNSTFEVILPFWAKAVLREDVARRRNGDLAAADAEIMDWFRVRGVTPQWVYNWQNLGAGSAALVYPADVLFLIYPSGTFVKGTSPLITIEMLHDSTLNAQNNFTAIFTEEAYNVMKLCHESRVVTVDKFCATGWTSLGTSITCA